jgi:hypothetical protein
MTLVGFVCGCTLAHPQDLEAALEDMPLVSAALLKAMEGSTAFVARAEVEVKYQTDPKPTTAVGVCAWQEKMLRWDINVSQFSGPLVSPQTAGAVNRLKLGPFVLLARSDRKLATLVLSGAKAYLETNILDPDRNRPRQRIPLGNEVLDGESCAKEKFSLSFGKRRTDVVVWNSQEQLRSPRQVKIFLESGTVLVRFRAQRPLLLLEQVVAPVDGGPQGRCGVEDGDQDVNDR